MSRELAMILTVGVLVIPITLGWIELAKYVSKKKEKEHDKDNG